MSISPAAPIDPTDSGSLTEVRSDLLAGFDQTLHRGHRAIEHLAFRASELDLDDALDPLGADHHRNPDVEPAHAVFAVERRGAGQHSLAVTQIALRHSDRRGRRRVKGRAGLQKIDDLRAAV